MMDTSLPTTPSQDQLAKISQLLERKFAAQEHQKKYAPVKEILTLIGRGAIISMALLAPKTAVVAKNLLEEGKDWEAWKRFNPSYLRYTLKRLEKQKVIEIIEENNKQVVKLSKKGQRKILRYALEELKIKKPKVWDRKWRIVIYDIPSLKKYLQILIRETLKRLGFVKLQESVYLLPYPCEDEIEFLREYYGLGENIKILTAAKLEDDEAYQTYFGI